MNKNIPAIFLIAMLINTNCMSQKNFTGEYSLQGIHEMASGFRFNKNQTFEFFYSYGAVDRFAKGTYTIEGNLIKLKSDKEGGKDFTVNKQSQKSGGYIVKIINQNNALVRNILCVAFAGKEEVREYTDSKGEVHFSQKHLDKINLQHNLFPDILTEIKGIDNKNTYFEVTLNPSLEQVSFKGIDFTINGDAITCLPNYFMPFEKIKYIKR